MHIPGYLRRFFFIKRDFFFLERKTNFNTPPHYNYCKGIFIFNQRKIFAKKNTAKHSKIFNSVARFAVFFRFYCSDFEHTVIMGFRFNSLKPSAFFSFFSSPFFF